MTDANGPAHGAGTGAVLGAEFAPAKINLALHVTGRRAGGYHLLDSLVVFAAIGDSIVATRSDLPGLDIDGPFADGLDTGPDNLVHRAARAHEAAGGRVGNLRLRLTKRLPVASGIGGGSADAAATLRLLAAIAPLPAGQPDAAPAIAATLGADVPMCLRSTPLRATGIGERLAPVPSLPRLPIILVNPGVAVSTPAVFQRLERADNPGLPAFPPEFADIAALAHWLRATRNDLEAPATAALPVIDDVLTTVRAAANCLLARMSGSGATVFGLFADDEAATSAAARIAALHPDWWVVATHA